MSGQVFSEQDARLIRAELNKILASESFINATRISDILRYVVEESLAGRRHRIKAFTIAQDVYGRDENFDQQRDPVIRVEASRLRKCLERYYESRADENTVRIDIPKGGYAPSFTWPETSVEKQHLQSRRWLLLFGLSVVVTFGLVWLLRNEGSKMTEPATSAFLAVIPFSYAEDDVRAASLSQNFVDSTITMLAGQPGLSVMAHASMMEFNQERVSIRLLKDDYGVTHVLRGSIETLEQELRIHSQLVDVSSSETVWSASMQGELSNIWLLQDELAAKVLSALSIELRTIEKEQILNRYTESPEALALYRQGLFLILPPSESKRVQAARQLFDRVIEIDPEFAGGYVGVAWSYALPVVFNTAQSPDEYLVTSTKFAREAIEVDPRFGAGYVVLAFAQVLSGEKADALENTRLAAAIQPGDAFVQFINGMVLTLAGLPAEALIPLNEALRLNPIETRAPYLNALAIASYADHEYESALDYLARNQARDGPRGPHMEAFRAAAHAQLGEKPEASAIVEELNRAFPNYPYRPWLERWIVQEEHLLSTLTKLSDLGLTVRDE